MFGVIKITHLISLNIDPLSLNNGDPPKDSIYLCIWLIFSLNTPMTDIDIEVATVGIAICFDLQMVNRYLIFLSLPSTLNVDHVYCFACLGPAASHLTKETLFPV